MKEEYWPRRRKVKRRGSASRRDTAVGQPSKKRLKRGKREKRGTLKNFALKVGFGISDSELKSASLAISFVKMR